MGSIHVDPMQKPFLFLVREEVKDIMRKPFHSWEVVKYFMQIPCGKDFTHKGSMDVFLFHFVFYLYHIVFDEWYVPRRSRAVWESLGL